MKIDYRHVNVKMGETLETDAPDDLYCIEHVDKGIRIESDGGYYELGNELYGENQDKHTGIIRIHNRLNGMRDALFVGESASSPVIKVL